LISPSLEIKIASKSYNDKYMSTLVIIHTIEYDQFPTDFVTNFG